LNPTCLYSALGETTVPEDQPTDEAACWDAVTDALSAALPGQKPPHWETDPLPGQAGPHGLSAYADPRAREAGNLRTGAKHVVPRADRAMGNPKQWLLGTHHGVSREHLVGYLDELVFRHNRRGSPMAAFQALLGLGTERVPAALGTIRHAADLPQFPVKP
jgi:hypothetical protein